ncbi:MAG: colanic acid biosynthesis glycosyltransferase WcaL [Ignavibacterium album]
MKVLHICDSFSPLSETFIYDYITELERQGIDNHVLTFTRINETDRPFDKVHVAKIKEDFIWFILRVIAEFNNKPNKFWAMQRREIKRIVKMVEPDIIHAHFGPMGVLVAPIAKKSKLPLVVTFYGYDASSLLKEEFWLKEYERLWSIVNGVTVLSKHMKDVLINIGCPENKISIIHLSRKLDDISIKNIPNEIKNFISIGRLTEKKGHSDTIIAIKKVLDKGYKIKLKIIGEGPLKEHLQKMIIDNKLQEDVKLLGAVKNEETLNQLYKSDAFILCSKTAENGDQEGTPTVLVEAQAIGLPCVSTCHAGIPEMVPEENKRFLAEEGNIEQIKDCIIRLINTDKSGLVKVVERGRKKVEQEFNLEIEVEKIINLYKGSTLNAK